MTTIKLQRINKKIKAKRRRLEECIQQKGFDLGDTEIISLSQELDRLVLLYCRYKGKIVSAKPVMNTHVWFTY
jgi:hypothetical protein